MELAVASKPMFSTKEIQERVKSQYIERVGSRLRKMRKLMMDRDWATLKTEAHQLAEGAQNFGYSTLATEVTAALQVLESQSLTRTAIDQPTKVALESLFKRLDRFLVDQNPS
jgi:HPt (histidine-containing phosphotransfer) domain-containing protein